MKTLAGVLILVFCLSGLAFAGDKEEMQLKLEKFQLQMSNISLAKQLLIKDMDQWNKLEGQTQDLNKAVGEFQKELAAKGFEISQDCKVTEKKAAEPKK
jgi:hypothetical protein